MSAINPRSILQLTITGFLSVTGLLFIALLITTRQLDGLGERHLDLMNETVMALSMGRRLTELTTAMERNARQYNVLGDADILTLYEERQSAFHDAATSLFTLEIDAELQSLVEDIRILEEQAHARLMDATSEEIEQLYGEILLVSNRIASAVTEWSNSRVIAIGEETEATRQLLTLQAFLVVGAALFLAAIFTALITRPLTQVKHAISQLGAGEYKDNIRIKGPSDLVSLGERLDWLRDRLAALEQQRSSFIRHVSHELKTPLAAIRESASLLEDGVVGELSDRQKQVLEIQVGNTRKLQKLIDELLRHHLASFSVIGTLPTEVHLDQLVKEVVTAHQVSVKTARLNVDMQLSQCSVTGNREQIRVALDNLLSNAIKYSPAGGAIRVTVRKESNHAVIEVHDAGPGVANEESERIFDAFYQGDPPDNDAYQGSGLGLAIAREYVTANGGDIALRSSDVGACFRVTLPQRSRRDDDNDNE